MKTNSPNHFPTNQPMDEILSYSTSFPKKCVSTKQSSTWSIFPTYNVAKSHPLLGPANSQFTFMYIYFQAFDIFLRSLKLGILYEYCFANNIATPIEALNSSVFPLSSYSGFYLTSPLIFTILLLEGHCWILLSTFLLTIINGF